MPSPARRFAKAFFRALLSFRGRISRSAYFAIMMGLAPVLYLRAHAAGLFVEDSYALNWLFYAVTPVAALVLYIGAAAMIRRLHDAGLAGYWFIAFLLFAAAVPGGRGVVLLLFCLVPGSRGDNRYGPPPPGLDHARAWLETYILDRRFAAGKMTPEDYNARRRALRERVLEKEDPA